MARHLSLLNGKLLDVAARRTKRLMVFVPPRHGKSTLCSHYFPAWFLGAHPDERIILASYEADFARSWGRKARDVLERNGSQFGVTVRQDSSAADRWDIAGRDGGMMTAGIGGPITGKGGSCIIDDPVKNAQQAASRTYQEEAWEWYESTLYTRLEPNGFLLLIMTRWNENDLAGRILRESPEAWDVLSLPALAGEGDALGRQVDEALWPERFDAEKLDKIRQTIGSYYWQALYQQRPSPREGVMFKRDWFPIVRITPDIVASVRGWDLAASITKQSDQTAGVKISKTATGKYVIEHVVCGRWSSGERDQVILQTAIADGPETVIVIEKEGGASGKTQAESLVRLLAGFAVKSQSATGSKEIRAEALASQAEAGNVMLASGNWNMSFLDEMASFPLGEHDDVVDAAAHGFNELASKRALFVA